MNFINGFMAATEDDDNTTAVTPEEAVAQAVDAQTELSDTSAEVEAVSADIEQDLSQMEAAAGESTDTLLEVQEKVDAANESGEGISPEVAEMASIAIETIRNNLRYPSNRVRIVPAAEAFGNTNTRLYSSKMVSESITETLGAVWERLKAWAKRIWDKFKLFISGIIKSVDGLEKIRKGLEERVKKIPSTAVPKAQELESKTLGNFFSVEGKHSDAGLATIFKNSVELVSASKKVVGEMAKYTEEVLKLEKGGAKTEDIVNKQEENNKKVYAALSTLSKVGEKTAKGKLGDEKITTYGPFPGNKFLQVKESVWAVTRDEKSNLTTLSFGWEKAKGQAATIPALKLDGIKKQLSDNIPGTIESLKKIKEMAKEVEKQTEATYSLISVMKDSFNGARETGNSDSAAAVAAIKYMTVRQLNALSTFANAPFTINFETCRRSLDYVSLSIKNLK